MNNDLYTLYAAENHIKPIKQQEIVVEEKKVQEKPKKEKKSTEDKIEEDIKPLID